jgi:electron transfer flavoprotein beta subunit
MHIVVCVKQVPNPEAAFSMLKVDELAKKVVPAAGLQLVMSPFDEQALEAALRIRESLGQAKVTAVSVGPDSARNTLKHALALGADEAILVRDAALEDCGSEAAALALAHAIRRLDAVDLVLTGRQAADWDAGVAGCGIAELLGLTVITFARKLEVSGRTLRVERVLADGFETLETELPALVTVSNELGEPRKPSLRETMRAARKPLAVRSAADIALADSDIAHIASRRVRERLYVPSKSGACELIAGIDEAAQAAALADKLRDARLV